RVMDNNTCAAFQQRRPVALDLSAAEAVVDPKEAAEHAGLTYVSDERPGLRRRKAGKGFCYVSPDAHLTAGPPQRDAKGQARRQRDGAEVKDSAIGTRTIVRAATAAGSCRRTR